MLASFNIQFIRFKQNRLRTALQASQFLCCSWSCLIKLITKDTIMVFSIFHAFLRDEVNKTNCAQADLDLDHLHMPLGTFCGVEQKKEANTELHLPADLTFPF